MKKLFATLLCLCMVFALLPGAALAENKELYIDHGIIIVTENGGGWLATTGATYVSGTMTDTLTIIGGAQTQTPNHIVIKGVGTEAAPFLLTLDSVNIRVTDEAALDLQPGSSVELTLSGINTLNTESITYAAVRVPLGSSLTITGGGTLNATAESVNLGSNGAAIGGSENAACGKITINGGTVNATAQWGAAIGGGSGAGVMPGGAGGNITINDGTVTASSFYGAAIGGGSTHFSDVPSGAGGDVTINNGTVTASSEYGAAIGGGGCFQNPSSSPSTGGAGGILTMTGGKLTAKNVKGYTAIGGGDSAGGTQGSPTTLNFGTFPHEWTHTVGGPYTPYGQTPFPTKYSTNPRAAYTSIQPMVGTPVFTPTAGTYTSAQSVTISCVPSDAVIHYTSDGSEPTETSPVYTAPIQVTATTTIKAIAIKAPLTTSAVAAATYTITTPGPNPSGVTGMAGGTYSGNQYGGVQNGATWTVQADCNKLATVFVDNKPL